MPCAGIRCTLDNYLTLRINGFNIPYAFRSDDGLVYSETRVEC
jgi:hypothetical protein